MVADIQLLQGKIVEDPESQRPKNFLKLMEELALEIMSEEDVAVATAAANPPSVQGDA